MRKKTTLQALTYYFTTNPVNLHTRYEFRSPIPLLTSFTHLLDINNVPRGRNLVDDWEDSYPIDLEYYYQTSVVRDTDSPLEAARIKQSETLVSFFASQLIDIPMCLRPARKSSSSYAGWPKSRFVTTLSRHGQNLKVSRLFAVSMLNLSRKTHLTNEEYLIL
jgi:hypothetical protein